MEPEKRIRHACARCRRQKLKCDNERPCPLCVRAKAECKDATERTRRSNRIRSTPRIRDRAEAHEPTAYRSPGPPRSLATSSSKPPDITELPDDNAEPAPPRRRQGGTTLPSATPSRDESYQGAIDIHVQERASAIHVVEKIFQQYRDSAPHRPARTDAIPDGSPTAVRLFKPGDVMIPVKTLIGIELPPENVTNALIESYLESMHWYLMVFHAPTLRARLAPILTIGLAPSGSRPFLLLVLIILMLGADQMSDQEKTEKCPRINLEDLTADLLTAAERWYLACMEDLTVESLAFIFLLSSRYLMNRQTKVAHIAMVTAIRAAQAIGLHRESSWGDIDVCERENRRRVWWAIFIGAGFISMSYGSPPMLNEKYCSVRQPIDMEDNSQTCPGMDSLELRDDGEFLPVTIGSYNRYKAKLYIIAIPLMRDVYFSRHFSSEQLMRRIKSYHGRLLDWERSIPPELRLESYAGRVLGDDPTLRLFSIQAFTLRVSYDNVHLFLFRPFISLDRHQPTPRCIDIAIQELSPPESSATDGSRAAASSASKRFIAIARSQCWTSAMRTSLIGQRLDVLKFVAHSFASVHVGVHAFSAGVMLSLLSLSDPLSSMAQESKRGMARLIQASSHLDLTIWKQLADVLTELMHIIATEETKTLISGELGNTSVNDSPNVAVFGSPPDHYSQESGHDRFKVSRQVAEPLTSQHGAPTHRDIAAEPVDRTVVTPEDYSEDAIQGMTDSYVDDEISEFTRHRDAQSTGWLGGAAPDVGQMWMWEGTYSYL